MSAMRRERLGEPPSSATVLVLYAVAMESEHDR
jgi:hypothetical protein